MCRLGLLAVLLVSAAVATGCGGADPSDEEAAREAVANLLAGIEEPGDISDACQWVTERGQQRIVRVMNEARDNDVRSCAEALGVLSNDAESDDLRAALGATQELLRGEEGPFAELGSEITVELTSSAGTVSVIYPDMGFPVAVRKVDGRWLVDDASALLFGGGTKSAR